jgi:hypothetical protein
MSNKWGMTLGLDIGQEQAAPNDSKWHTWFTPQAIIRYKPTETVAVATRGEYYSDPRGVVIGYALPGEFKATGLSLNLDYTPVKQAMLRIEGRWLHNISAVFPNDGDLSENNFSLLCALSVRL